MIGVTDTQLYLSIGLPVLAVLLTFVGNSLQMSSVSARITSLESTMSARFSSVENRLVSLEARFETLTGKVIEVDNRLTRVEAILERH